jgi:predicted nucleotidyltransferase
MRKLSRCRRISEFDRQLMLDLKKIVESHVPDAEVILYGSAARGTREPDSDYDVLVLTPRKLSSKEEEELDAAVYHLQLEREVVLSAMVYAQTEWTHPIVLASPYRKNVIKDGIAL